MSLNCTFQACSSKEYAESAVRNLALSVETPLQGNPLNEILLCAADSSSRFGNALWENQFDSTAS